MLISPSGKAYVGQTRGLLSTRLRQHCIPTTGCSAIAGAIQKYEQLAPELKLVDWRKLNKANVRIRDRIIIPLTDAALMQYHSMVIGQANEFVPKN